MKRHWLLLALSIAGLPAVAADMYSWTDANGVKHFSDSPPPANVTRAQKLKVSGGVTTGSAADEGGGAATPSGPDLAAAAGYSPEDIRRNCEVAKRNLTVLEDQKPEADGEAAKTQAAQIEKANQQIKLFCTGH
jgi:hypothetical protein